MDLKLRGCVVWLRENGAKGDFNSHSQSLRESVIQLKFCSKYSPLTMKFNKTPAKRAMQIKGGPIKSSGKVVRRRRQHQSEGQKSSWIVCDHSGSFYSAFKVKVREFNLKIELRIPFDGVQGWLALWSQNPFPCQNYKIPASSLNSPWAPKAVDRKVKSQSYAPHPLELLTKVTSILPLYQTDSPLIISQSPS